MARINTKSAKQKGRLGQDAVRQMILDAFPEFTEEDIKTAIMGEKGDDIKLSPQAKEKIPLAIEVKRRKSFKLLYDFIEQADRKDGRNPVVFLRGDRQPWLVILKADYFMELIKK